MLGNFRLLSLLKMANSENGRIELTDGYYLFAKNVRLDCMEELLKLFTKLKKAEYMFYDADDLKELKAEYFDGLDTSELETLANFISYNSTVTSIDLSFIKSKVLKNISYMFSNCMSLTNANVNDLYTSNVTNVSGAFMRNNILETLDLSNWDLGKVTNIGDFLNNCGRLTNFKCPKNIGKGFTQTTNNYYTYKFDVSTCNKLSHESLMSIINNLYDLNLTYDVANGGTLYTQQLILGSTNIAKLTADEIAIATNKGWTVS